MKRWFLVSGLATTVLFLSGCMRVDQAGNPQGWFSNLLYNYLVIPTEMTLEFFAEVTGSYGVAIILLTLMIRLILMPLTLKQQKSMMENQYKMSAITPVINEIQQEMKETEDPQTKQELQAEMMSVYQENDVNIVGQITGCFPVIVQMPIFIAILHVLRTSQSIANASFLGIQLGQPSILFAILTTAIYYVQSKLSMSRMPESARQQTGMMTLVMPITMFIMTFSAPAGFALYFFAGGIIAILEQLFVNHYFKPKIEAQLKEKHGETQVVQRKKKTSSATEKVTNPRKDDLPTNQPSQEHKQGSNISAGQQRRRNEGKQRRRR